MTANTVVTSVLTVAALGTATYSGVLGAKIAKAGPVSRDGVTEPASTTPDEVAAAQKQPSILQWASPALVLAIIALGSQQGEQQRPSQIAGGLIDRISQLTNR